jgi:hypothetical protein
VWRPCSGETARRALRGCAVYTSAILEEAARAEAFAFEMHRNKLAVLGVTSDDLLMQVPKGPGPSRQELREV